MTDRQGVLSVAMSADGGPGGGCLLTEGLVSQTVPQICENIVNFVSLGIKCVTLSSNLGPWVPGPFEGLLKALWWPPKFY